MKRKTLFIFCVLMLYSFTALASEYSLDVGIASGNRDAKAYLLGIKKMYQPLAKRGTTSIVPFVGLTGFVWHSSKKDDVFGATLSGGLSFRRTGRKSNTYLALSVGPTLISRKYLGTVDMGSRFHFNTTFSLGISFGKSRRHSLEAFYSHYSNAGLASENPGHNIYGGAYRYSF